MIPNEAANTPLAADIQFMNIDWVLVATIAAPILTLFAGVALDRFLERKPRVVAYFSHTSVFRVAGNPPFPVHTHGIVIKNTGRQPAADIRVRHRILPPNFQLFPDIAFTLENLPSGGVEIVVPRLVPNEQVSITYLYFPPLLFSQIHDGIRHSQGFADEITMLPTPHYPKWVSRLLALFVWIGIVAVVYVFALFSRAAWVQFVAT